MIDIYGFLWETMAKCLSNAVVDYIGIGAVGIVFFFFLNPILCKSTKVQSISQLKHMDLMITKHDKTEEDTLQVTIWQVHSTKITES